MKSYQSWFYLAILILVIFAPDPVSSAYLEGIDTTDINGFSQDSAFRVLNANVIMFAGIKMICFKETRFSCYFHYKFDDINKVPDTFIFSRTGFPLTFNSCFVVQRSKDSAYLKFSILEKLSDGRYLYRYGLNTKPNDLLLIKSDYDREIKYKPNNFYRSYSYRGNFDSLYWEPPIPNNNHLSGYIIYMARPTTIDTTVPVNMAQWDSVTFTDLTRSTLPKNNSASNYVNLVAVYTEGRSNFLLGWTLFTLAVGAKPSENARNFAHRLSVSNAQNGFLFDFKSQNPQSVLILNPAGRQVVKFTDISNNRLFWATSGDTFLPGVYVLRAVFSDKNHISQTFLAK